MTGGEDSKHNSHDKGAFSRVFGCLVIPLDIVFTIFTVPIIPWGLALVNITAPCSAG